MPRHLHVAYISTYPPRECGIANFTKELVDAISETRRAVSQSVIALSDPDSLYNYDRIVKSQVEEDVLDTYMGCRLN